MSDITPQLFGVQTYSTGATRGASEGKPDYEGYLSPLVIHRMGQYMQKHQLQADGTYRASDNWQKGIPQASYIKSLWRHFLDVWLYHRGYNQASNEPFEDALCGVMFNAMGALHETLRRKLGL